MAGHPEWQESQDMRNRKARWHNTENRPNGSPYIINLFTQVLIYNLQGAEIRIVFSFQWVLVSLWGGSNLEKIREEKAKVVTNPLNGERQATCLKGAWHEIFDLRFLLWTSFLQAP